MLFLLSFNVVVYLMKHVFRGVIFVDKKQNMRMCFPVISCQPYFKLRVQMANTIGTS